MLVKKLEQLLFSVGVLVDQFEPVLCPDPAHIKLSIEDLQPVLVVRQILELVLEGMLEFLCDSEVQQVDDLQDALRHRNMQLRRKRDVHGG